MERKSKEGIWIWSKSRFSLFMSKTIWMAAVVCLADLCQIVDDVLAGVPEEGTATAICNTSIDSLNFKRKQYIWMKWWCFMAKVTYVKYLNGNPRGQLWKTGRCPPHHTLSDRSRFGWWRTARPLYRGCCDSEEKQETLRRHSRNRLQLQNIAGRIV